MRCSTLPDRYPDLSRLGCTVLAPLCSRWKVRVGLYSQHPCSMRDFHLRVLPVPPGKKRTRQSRPLAEAQETGLLLASHNLSDMAPVWAHRPDRKKARSTRANPSERPPRRCVPFLHVWLAPRGGFFSQEENFGKGAQIL